MNATEEIQEYADRLIELEKNPDDSLDSTESKDVLVKLIASLVAIQAFREVISSSEEARMRVALRALRLGINLAA